MAEPAVFYQCGACCFKFTSDDVWQYFFKHVCVDDKGNVLPPLGKWEKRMNAEKTVPIITGISEIFAQIKWIAPILRVFLIIPRLYARKMCRANYFGILLVSVI